MSLANFIQPLLAAVPTLMKMTSVLLVLTAVSVVIVMFKPMLLGIWRASRLYLKQISHQQRQN